MFSVLYIIIIILFHTQIVPYLAKGGPFQICFCIFLICPPKSLNTSCFVAQLYITALDYAPDLVLTISPRSPSFFSSEWCFETRNWILLLLGVVAFLYFHWTDILSLYIDISYSHPVR